MYRLVLLMSSLEESAAMAPDGNEILSIWNKRNSVLRRPFPSRFHNLPPSRSPFPNTDYDELVKKVFISFALTLFLDAGVEIMIKRAHGIQTKLLGCLPLLRNHSHRTPSSF